MNENDYQQPTVGPAIQSTDQEVHPGIAISPEINPVQGPAPKRRWPKLLVGLVGAVIVLGGLAFLGYNQGYTLKGFTILTPAKIWDSFYLNDKAKIYTSTFTIDYHDPEQMDNQSDQAGIILKDVKVHVEGTAYANMTSKDKPEVDGTTKFSVGSGNSSFSSGLDYRAKNGNLFYKIGDIPFLSSILGPQSRNTDWVKINLEKAKSQSSEESDLLRHLADPTFQDQLRKIWLDNRAIKLNKYVGREKINGASTLHFQAELDKEATKTAVMKTFDAIAALGKNGSIKPEDRDILETVTNKILDKVEVKELDVWVGVTDQNIYKLHLSSNMPSFISFVNAAMDEESQFSNATTPEEQKQEVVKFLSKLNFDATFNIDATYSDYGKTKAVEEPAGAVDVFDLAGSTGTQ